MKAREGAVAEQIELDVRRVERGEPVAARAHQPRDRGQAVGPLKLPTTGITRSRCSRSPHEGEILLGRQIIPPMPLSIGFEQQIAYVG